MKYNHKRPLEDFMPDIKKIRAAGYNPIAVTQMYFEDTYVFKTSEEAKVAYKELEQDGNYRLGAWWYGIEDFKNEVKDYESKNGACKVKIYWLDKD